MLSELDPSQLPLESEAATRPNALIAELNKHAHLTLEDEAAITRITRTRRTMRAHEALFERGRKADNICLILTGVAMRYRHLADGRRQIFGYLLPGNVCDTHYVVSNECDHNVQLLSDSEVALISIADLKNTMFLHPTIERALLMMELVEAATLREWLLNVGQRDAFQKLAHFFCEITARLHALGAVSPDGSYCMPLTQIELADTIGLTVVHVNRILQRFRHQDILVWTRGRLTILDQRSLESIAGFNKSYLHLDQ